MVDVFREVRRVLRADGTLWLNLGDSYAQRDRSAATTSTRGRGRRAASASARQRRAGSRDRRARRVRPQAEGPRRHPVAGRVRPPGGRLVSPLRHHLVEAEPDARVRHRPADEGARVPVPAVEVAAVLLRRGRGAGGAREQRSACAYGSATAAATSQAIGVNGNAARHWRRLGAIRPPVATSAPSGPSPPQPYPGAHFATFPPQARGAVRQGGVPRGRRRPRPLRRHRHRGHGGAGCPAGGASTSTRIPGACLARNAQTPLG